MMDETAARVKCGYKHRSLEPPAVETIQCNTRPASANLTNTLHFNCTGVQSANGTAGGSLVGALAAALLGN